MCTAITMKTAEGETFFGRTMDFSYPIQPAVYVMPGNYQWNNALGTVRITNPYSFIGIGQESGMGILFADGVNEMGVGAAALYFPGYAAYGAVEEMTGDMGNGGRMSPGMGMGRQGEPGSSGRFSGNGTKPRIAAVEFLPFLLGSCDSVDRAARAAEAVELVGMADPVTGTIAPLHWMVADQSGRSVVIESTAEGVRVMENPVGVLTNSPDFPWQITNLRNYVEADPVQREAARWEEAELTPFGQGGGTSVLPGGFTPPARFVRAAFLKSHMPVPQDRTEAVGACFHVLENVSVPRGAVRTASGAEDYTRYTACLNTATGEYYIKTYENGQIRTARLEYPQARGTAPARVGFLDQEPEFFPLG